MLVRRRWGKCVFAATSSRVSADWGGGMPSLSGETTSHDLQYLKNGAWIFLRTLDPSEQPREAAEQARANSELTAVRVVENRHDAAYQLTRRLTAYRSFSQEGEVGDMLISVPVGSATVCAQATDLYRPTAIDDARGLVTKFLNDSKVSLLEVMHDFSLASRMDNTPMLLQGACQKVAGHQARGGLVSVGAPKRSRELMKLCEDALKRLDQRFADKQRPIIPMPMDNLATEAEAIRSTEPAPEQDFEIGLRITATLREAGDWLGKLNAVVTGDSDGLGDPDRRLLDLFLADLLALPQCLRSLTGAPKPRRRLLWMLAGIHGGAYQPDEDLEKPVPPALVEALNRVMKRQSMKRSRWLIRQALVAEIDTRRPLADNTVGGEMTVLADFCKELSKLSVGLTNDPDVKLALESRAARMAGAGRVADDMATMRSLAERFAHIARLISLAPGSNNKAVLAQYAREMCNNRDDLLASFLGYSGQGEPLELGASVLRALFDSKVPSEIKADLGRMMDGLMVEILRDRLAKKRKLSGPEIMKHLLRCGQLPEGDAATTIKTLAIKLVKQPDFLPSFVSSYKSDADRKRALLRFREFLASTCGFLS